MSRVDHDAGQHAIDTPGRGVGPVDACPNAGPTNRRRPDASLGWCPRPPTADAFPEPFYTALTPTSNASLPHRRAQRPLRLTLHVEH